MKFCGDKRYGTLHSLLKTGDIYDVDLCYHQIPEILDPFDNEAFAKKSSRIFVVCTDVNRKGCLSQMHQIVAEMILDGICINAACTQR